MASRAHGVILDVDGTLLVGDRAIPGAKETLHRIREAALSLGFATNTTRMSKRMIINWMHQLGLQVHWEELVTAPQVAAGVLARRGFRRVLPLLPKHSWEDLGSLEFLDIALLTEHDERYANRTERQSDPGQIEAVILGDLGDDLTFQHLNQAFRAILSGAHLVALHRNRFWRVSDGLRLDAGAFVAALEYATGVSAHLVGKPAAEFFETVMAVVRASGDASIAPETVWMVGDDISADIAGGHRAGLRTCLVRTGKYCAGDLAAAEFQPDVEIDSVADLPTVLGLG